MSRRVASASAANTWSGSKGSVIDTTLRLYQSRVNQRVRAGDRSPSARDPYPDAMTGAAVDLVLSAAPPTFSDEEAARLARDLFGVDGSAVSVESERDQTFLID